MVVTSPDVDRIQYRPFNAYSTLEQCQQVAMGLQKWMEDVEKQKNRPYWINAYCLPVEAFEENLIKPKEKKSVNETST
tara:strand:+ start:1897 stop:2130 length:234 start_codon:yes stop_codon:yes gene_type:complete